MRAVFGIMLFAIVVPSLASARDIYVDNVNGDDRLGGFSPTAQGESGGPCRSIAKALRIARLGDRVVLTNTGVPYRECVTIQGPRSSGDDNFPLQIQGNGATLEGTI